MASSRLRVRVWASVVSCIAVASPIHGQGLGGEVDRAILASKLTQAKVSVSIADASTGQAILERDADRSLAPASNMKLLTTGAALIVLGEGFVFRTVLLLDGDRLVIVGSGDPGLADPVLIDRMGPDMSVEKIVDALADAVTVAGVDRVSEIVLDDRVFDREYIHPLWPKDQLLQKYCAQVSGVNFHANVIAVFPLRGGSPGSTSRYTTEPAAAWLPFDVRATTVNTGKNSVRVVREDGSNRFTIFGEIGADARGPEVITVHEPHLLLGQMLAARLLDRGVAIGETRRAGTTATSAELVAAFSRLRVPDSGDAAFQGRTLAIITTPIEDILTRCNTDSQNLYAEALLKRIGHEVTGEPGSWANGASVVRMLLADLVGPEHAARAVISDGSGLSRENRVSASTLTAWLSAIHSRPAIAGVFARSMARPGEGTLEGRWSGVKLASEVRGKSGKIDGVRCLSGYVIAPSGRPIAYSVLINDMREGDQVIPSRKLQEDVVTAIDRWAARLEPATAGG